MAVTTVAQLAAELNRPAASLLEQLGAAGVAKGSVDDGVTEADKARLLDHLRSAHGNVAPAERKKISITRKSNTEIKQADATGKARTIQVQVVKKRTFVRRDDTPAGSSEAPPPPAPVPMMTTTWSSFRSNVAIAVPPQSQSMSLKPRSM